MEIVYAAAESRDDVRLRTVLITTPVDTRNTTGHTALMFAAEKGGVSAVNALLDKGADANVQSNNGNTALMFASKRGHVAVIEALLKHGASITAKNNNGDWALTFAVAEGRVAVAECLLKSGGDAEINARNNSGDTALMMACRNGALSCMELLINHRSSDKVVNNEDQTVYDLCKDKKTLAHLHSVISTHKARMVTEEAERCRQRHNKLHLYIKESINAVRLKYISDFKGKLFTRQASKADLEACDRFELMETYELLSLLKSLSVHLAGRREYSTLDKRLMSALGNPYSSQVQSAKPLLDRLINAGTIFPSEPAKRSDIGTYRVAYINAIADIVKEVEDNAVVLAATDDSKPGAGVVASTDVGGTSQASSTTS